LYTYCFEIIYPGSRIVVNYKDRCELVLLGVLGKHNNHELDHIKEAQELGLNYAREFHFEKLDLHRIITGFSEKDVWEALKHGKTLDDMLNIVPDEFYQWMKKTESDLKSSKDHHGDRNSHLPGSK
jgi:RNA ligase